MKTHTTLSACIAACLMSTSAFAGGFCVVEKDGCRDAQTGKLYIQEGNRLVAPETGQVYTEDQPVIITPRPPGSSSANTPPSPGESYTLTADSRGHFITTGSINGSSVRMLVDTGATAVSMSADEAWRIGLPYLNGKRVRLSTANGIITGYRVMLDTVEVGNITLNQVEGVVQEGSIGENSMPFVLLGMSFLNRVKMKHEGANLTLIRK